MKSLGSLRFHHRVTSSLLLKNLCPPMSNRNPPFFTVREMPPTYSGSFARAAGGGEAGGARAYHNDAQGRGGVGHAFYLR